MKEKECGDMIESRCGIKCGSCAYKEQMGCAGCLHIQKPFWGEGCPVKSCVEEKKLQHCGECETFPCELAKAFAYDEKQGDGGERLKTAAGGCLVSRGVCVYNRGLLYEQGALDQCTIRSGLPGFVDGPHGEELYRLSVYADKETAAAYCRESSAYLVL